MPRKDFFMTVAPKLLRNTEKRTRKQTRNKSVDLKKTKEYELLLEKLRKIEDKKEKLELAIKKKLEPVRVSLGIDKLEDQILALDDQLDEVYEEKERLEILVIQDISTGSSVKDFFLRLVSKRFSPKYKAICEEIFKGRPKDFEEAKNRHGSRKEQYILLFKGEEVSRQLAEHVVPMTSQASK